MAKLNDSILGGLSGKLGPIVGASWKGIPYIKARNRSRTKKISDLEKGNRERFKIAQQWLQPLLDFLRIGFKGYTPTVEGFIAAKSYLMKNAMEGSGAESKVIPSKVLVSYGDMPLSDNIRAELLNNNELVFSWDPETPHDASYWDQVMLLAYDVVERYAYEIAPGPFRHMGTYSVELSPGGTYHVYLAFIAQDRSKQSNSVYLGEFKT